MRACLISSYLILCGSYFVWAENVDCSSVGDRSFCQHSTCREFAMGEKLLPWCLLRVDCVSVFCSRCWRMSCWVSKWFRFEVAADMASTSFQRMQSGWFLATK